MNVIGTFCAWRCPAMIAACAITGATPLAAATSMYAQAFVTIEDAFSTGGDGTPQVSCEPALAFADVLLAAPGAVSESSPKTSVFTNLLARPLNVGATLLVSTLVEVDVTDLDPGLYDLSAAASVGYRIGDGAVRTIFDDIITTQLDCTSGTCGFSSTAGELIDDFNIALIMGHDSTQDVTLFASACAALTRVAPPTDVPLPAGFGLALLGGAGRTSHGSGGGIAHPPDACLAARRKAQPRWASASLSCSIGPMPPSSYS